MGFLRRLQERAEEKRAEQAREAEEEAFAEWQRRYDLVKGTIDMIKVGGIGPDHPQWAFPIQPQKEERVFAAFPGVSLVEPRRTRGQYQGGTSGVSIRIMKGVSYRTAATKGTYQPGPELMTTVDQGGTAYFTNKRVMYLGTSRTLEWKFDKLLGFQHDEQMGATFLQVSNRQKTSGIYYGPPNLPAVALRLGAALAAYNHTENEAIDDLTDQLSDLEAERPIMQLPPG
jgi:hypothetical protein